MDEQPSQPPHSNTTVSNSRQPLFKKLFALVAICIILPAFYYKSTVKVDENDCYSEFSHGQWVGQRWYPYECIIDRYPTKTSLVNCVKTANARVNIHFIGDGALSIYFHALVMQFNPSNDYVIPEDLENSSPLIFQNDIVSLEYTYMPVLSYQLIHQYKYVDKERVPHLIINSFNGFKGNPSRRSCLTMGEKLIKFQSNLMERIKEEDQNVPVILMLFQNLDSNEDNACQRSVQEAFDETSKISPLLRASTVLLHLNESQSLQGLETIVHFICNSATKSSCCINGSNNHGFWSAATLPFLLLCLALYMGMILLRSTGTLLPLEPYIEAAKINLNKVYIVIHIMGFCVISALYVYSAEGLQVFTQASPWRSPLLMILFLVAIVCLGFIKIERLNQLTTTFMCKEQVTEWRGVSILLVLALEYSNTAESGLGFWVWQFGMCCYCFTIGYSHFVWFCTNSDYNIWRVIKVVIKQNYFMMVVILTIFSPIAIYTVPLVNTIIFFIVYIVMVMPPRQILADSSKGSAHAISILTKIIIAGFLIVFVTIIELHFFAPLFLNSTNPRAYFTIIHSTRMMAVLGMLVGYYSIMVTGPTVVQTLLLTNQINGIIVLAGIAIYIIFMFIAKQTKFFIVCHMFTVMFPIFSYCILRNWNDILKSSHSYILKYIGSMSVELYVLSRHVLLSHNGWGLLYLFSGYFAINMLSTLFIVFLLSYFVSDHARTFDKEILSVSPVKSIEVQHVDVTTADNAENI